VDFFGSENLAENWRNTGLTLENAGVAIESG